MPSHNRRVTAPKPARRRREVAGFGSIPQASDGHALSTPLDVDESEDFDLTLELLTPWPDADEILGDADVSKPPSDVIGPVVDVRLILSSEGDEVPPV